MRKQIILIDKKTELSDKDFQTQLQALLNKQKDNFVTIKYAVQNTYSLPAKPLEIINSAHPKDAIISLWSIRKTNASNLFTTIAKNTQYYSVNETPVLSQTELKGPTEGLCQIALLQKPENLSREQWLHNWQGLHTQVAVETQSNFIYRQNVCEHTENEGNWPPLDAIVEEIFPTDAMTDRQVFFNAKGDEKAYRSNEKKMIESCMRFIDFSRFDCLPMQEIIIKPLPNKP